MRYPPKFKKDVRQAVQKYSRILNSTTEFYLKWADEDTKKPADTYADILINTPYTDATITIYPLLLEAWKKDKYIVDSRLAHEVAHTFVEPIIWLSKRRFITEDQVDALCETQTDLLAQIMRKFK